jgi:hypothetical protein
MSPSDLPDPPPPSEALLAAMGRVAPVRTRRPLRAFAVVAAASLAYTALWLLWFPPRQDLPFLPRLVWGAELVVWLAAFVGTMAAAIVPRRGAVLPDAPRAGRFALVGALGLIALGLVAAPGAPGHTLYVHGAQEQVGGILRCMTFGLMVALLPLTFALVALRRVLLVGSTRLMAAAGAAGGALGGLTLHVLCPVGGGLHVGFGHGGAVAVAALLGAGIGAIADRLTA